MNIVLTILTHWKSILFDRECEETNQKINNETGGKGIYGLQIKSVNLNSIWKVKIREILSYSDPMILSISKSDSKMNFLAAKTREKKSKEYWFSHQGKAYKNEICIILVWVYMEMNGVFDICF